MGQEFSLTGEDSSEDIRLIPLTFSEDVGPVARARALVSQVTSSEPLIKQLDILKTVLDNLLNKRKSLAGTPVLNSLTSPLGSARKSFESLGFSVAINKNKLFKDEKKFSDFDIHKAFRFSSASQLDFDWKVGDDHPEIAQTAVAESQHFCLVDLMENFLEDCEACSSDEIAEIFVHTLACWLQYWKKWGDLPPKNEDFSNLKRKVMKSFEKLGKTNEDFNPKSSYPREDLNQPVELSGSSFRNESFDFTGMSNGISKSTESSLTQDSGFSLESKSTCSSDNSESSNSNLEKNNKTEKFSLAVSILSQVLEKSSSQNILTNSNNEKVVKFESLSSESQKNNNFGGKSEVFQADNQETSKKRPAENWRGDIIRTFSSVFFGIDEESEYGTSDEDESLPSDKKFSKGVFGWISQMSPQESLQRSLLREALSEESQLLTSPSLAELARVVGLAVSASESNPTAGSLILLRLLYRVRLATERGRREGAEGGEVGGEMGETLRYGNEFVLLSLLEVLDCFCTVRSFRCESMMGDWGSRHPGGGVEPLREITEVFSTPEFETGEWRDDRWQNLGELGAEENRLVENFEEKSANLEGSFLESDFASWQKVAEILASSESTNENERNESESDRWQTPEAPEFREIQTSQNIAKAESDSWQYSDETSFGLTQTASCHSKEDVLSLSEIAELTIGDQLLAATSLDLFQLSEFADLLYRQPGIGPGVTAVILSALMELFPPELPSSIKLAAKFEELGFRESGFRARLLSLGTSSHADVSMVKAAVQNWGYESAPHRIARLARVAVGTLDRALSPESRKIFSRAVGAALLEPVKKDPAHRWGCQLAKAYFLITGAGDGADLADADMADANVAAVEENRRLCVEAMSANLADGTVDGLAKWAASNDYPGESVGWTAWLAIGRFLEANGHYEVLESMWKKSILGNFQAINWEGTGIDKEALTAFDWGMEGILNSFPNESNPVDFIVGTLGKPRNKICGILLAMAARLGSKIYWNWSKRKESGQLVAKLLKFSHDNVGMDERELQWAVEIASRFWGWTIPSIESLNSKCETSDEAESVYKAALIATWTSIATWEGQEPIRLIGEEWPK